MGKRRDQNPGGSQATIGEMMFAKAVIEEKNELIDRKDDTIRELVSKLRAAESEIENLRITISENERRQDFDRIEGRREAVNHLISEVVRIAADWDDLHGPSPAGLSARILDLFRQEYGLDLIEDAPHGIDPELHQVVGVDHSDVDQPGVEILSAGYRIGDAVIRPALVKVVLGLRSNDALTLSPEHARPGNSD